MILVGANDYRDTQHQMIVAGFYRTTDGGLTWSDALLTLGSPTFYEGCDPAVTADAEGRFFAVYQADTANIGWRAYVQVSTDLGATWGPCRLASLTNSQTDKSFCSCDISATSPYHDNVYVSWTDMTSFVIDVARSTDHGQTFSAPTQISTHTTCQGSITASGPNGDVYAAWVYGGSPSAIECNRSTNGGASWGTAHNIANCSGLQYYPARCGTYRIPNCPSIGCDITNGPHRGWVYATWTSQISGSDLDICFSRSTDGGQTWSAPVQINVDPQNRMQFFPWLVVHPRTGDIAVSWMDCAADPTECSYRATGTISTDGGSTWSSNVSISDQASNAANSDFVGDYTGCTFSSRGFFSSWPDLRNDGGDAYGAWWNDTMFVHLDYPQGGEAFGAGQEVTVRWHDRYMPDSVLVELNRTYPSAAWDTLGKASCIADSFIWHVTNPLSDHARLRLISAVMPEKGDASDADFVLGMPIPTRVTAYRIGADI